MRCLARERLELIADAEHAAAGPGSLVHGDLVVQHHVGTCSTCEELYRRGLARWRAEVQRRALELFRNEALG